MLTPRALGCRRIYATNRWVPEYEVTVGEGEAIVFPPNYMHETYVHPDDNRRAPPTRAHAACRHASCHDRGSPRAKLPAS